ncbi:MAG: diguanylate cyclase [Halomonas sp.]|nr:diguanylate cyclase [Halomonas sp.]
MPTPTLKGSHSTPTPGATLPESERTLTGTDDQEATSQEQADRSLAQLGPEVELNLKRDLHWLRFSPALERLFERETSRSRARHLLLGGMIAIVIYDLFLITDYVMLPDIFLQALTVRLGILTPLALALMGCLARGLPSLLRESLEAGIVLAAAASLVYLLAQTEHALSTYYHTGLILMILFGNVVVRLRFWFAVCTSLLIICLYALVRPGPETLPDETLFINVVMMATCAIFTLFANYILERDQRRSYLINLRERVRRAELAMSNAELTRLSYADPLTGIANRRELNRYLKKLADSRGLERIAFILFDIDHFKRYNDYYGHPAGDACLIRVAEILRTSLFRPSDMVARIGGEEFLVVLPESNREMALLVAERLRVAVEAVAIPHEASPTAMVVTLSAGVSDGPMNGDVLSVLAAADTALYRAKRDGRNRVSD